MSNPKPMEWPEGPPKLLPVELLPAAIAERMEYLGRRKLTLKTLERHKEFLGWFLEFIVSNNYQNVDTESIDAFLIFLRTQRGFGDWTMWWIKSNVKMFFGWLVKWRWIAENPTTWCLVDCPPGPVHSNTYTSEEYEKVKAVLGPGSMRGMFVMAYRIGTRSIDAAKMTWKHVDLESQVITYTPIKTVKFSIVCVAPIPSGSDLMEELIIARKVTLGSGPLWPEYEKQKNPSIKIGVRLEIACRRAGVPYKCFHCLRRTCITNLLGGGVDVYTAMRITGLRSLKTILHYAHPNKNALRIAIEKGMEFAQRT